jgi:hypothetical protein
MRLSALGALAVGYVLGAKAGRKRYEQIRQLASGAAQRLESYGSSGTLATRVTQLDHGNGHRAGRE